MRLSLTRVIWALVTLAGLLALWMSLKPRETNWDVLLEGSAKLGGLRDGKQDQSDEKLLVAAPKDEKLRAHQPGEGTELCRRDPTTRRRLFSTYPLCTVARKQDSHSPLLPPIADAFATGTPCVSSLPSSAGEAERRRLTPTVHFVLNLDQPGDGASVDLNYERWFPKSEGYSSLQYRCVFSDGRTSPVTRTQNHDRDLWPENGECAKAERFRSVVLMCQIPLDTARELLRGLAQRSKQSVDSNVEESVNSVFKVTLARVLEKEKEISHIPLSFACPFYKPSRDVVGVLKPIPVISLKNAELAETEPKPEHELSVGICTMVNSECGLQEWLEYNQLIGVSNAYIYDNTRTAGDSQRLSKAVHSWNKKRGRGRFARIIHWHMTGKAGHFWVTQSHAMNSCIRRFSSFHQWVAVSDTDERIVPLNLSTAKVSLVSLAITSLYKYYEVQSHSSLVLLNWDMIRNGTSTTAEVCGDSSRLLIESADLQCLTGPTESRTKSFMSTDYAVNQIIDQGHCTVIGKAPLNLNPETEMRLNHYFSKTHSLCKRWTNRDPKLLTSRHSLFKFMKQQLKSFS